MRNIAQFRNIVWDYYRKQGRHDLPWRRTKDSYKILVSELMLQQTQVQRVLPKYSQFLKLFPTIKILAAAPLSEVLKVWQGLGYNRRAKFVHQLAREVVKNHQGKLPCTESELIVLPGIGKATAAALMAFAFNAPTTYLETNVRSVFLHHFFKDSQGVSDAQLVPLIAAAAEGQDPRTWNWALLDYGVYIKATYGNPNVKSKHHVTQSKFIGSTRQLRGAILRLLSARGALTKAALLTEIDEAPERTRVVLNSLVGENLVTQKGNVYQLG